MLKALRESGKVTLSDTEKLERVCVGTRSLVQECINNVVREARRLASDLEAQWLRLEHGGPEVTLDDDIVSAKRWLEASARLSAARAAYATVCSATGVGVSPDLTPLPASEDSEF